MVASVDPKLRQADGKSLVTQESSICEPNGCASQSADGSFRLVVICSELGPRILFYIFLVIFIVLLVLGLVVSRRF